MPGILEPKCLVRGILADFPLSLQLRRPVADKHSLALVIRVVS